VALQDYQGFSFILDTLRLLCQELKQSLIHPGVYKYLRYKLYTKMTEPIGLLFIIGKLILTYIKHIVDKKIVHVLEDLRLPTNYLDLCCF